MITILFDDNPLGRLGDGGRGDEFECRAWAVVTVEGDSEDVKGVAEVEGAVEADEVIGFVEAFESAIGRVTILEEVAVGEEGKLEEEA